MSDGEEEPETEFLGFYGKPLELFDEDTIPKKRPISIEDQVAKDAQGRRRFHGAFTGGFSAGFFNTVGSLEGWQPTEFKSSRSEKAGSKVQKPEDYMDDEDIGEFGIAPQKIKATDDYNTSKKRKRQVFADGPIPGDPVLHGLIECGNDTIGYLLLRNIGYKYDEEEDREDDEDVEAIEENVGKKVYGCEMPKVRDIKSSYQLKDTVIGEIYEKALKQPKSDTFGMGYEGLDRSHVNLFTSSKLVVNERNKKKLSIAGQAFGVGAFEDEDEDIYVKEDLSNYDFEMTSEKAKTKIASNEKLLLGLFVKSKRDYKMTDKFPPPMIPSSFSGIHKLKKSRFEPISTEIERDNIPNPKRSSVDAKTRAMLLNDPQTRTQSSNAERFKTPAATTSAKISEKNVEEALKKPPKESKFKLEPPPSTSGLIFDKFVSSSSKLEEFDEAIERSAEVCEYGTVDMREAVKKKLFGLLTRVTQEWMPNSLLCKRFNVPEPTSSSSDIKTPKPRKRNLIFTNSQFEDAKMEFTDTQVGLQNRSEPQTSTSTSSTTFPPFTPETVVIDEQPKEPVVENVTTSTTNEENVTTSTTNEENKQKETKQLCIDPIEKIDIQKNIDLFKAIFLDSDSEDNNEEDSNRNMTIDDKTDPRLSEDQIRVEELKIKVLSDDLLLPQIKPLKPGILSHVNEIFPIQRNNLESKSDETDKDSKNFETDDSYGPKLPTRNNSGANKSENGETVKNNKAGNSDSDEWVEKIESEHKSKKKDHKKKKKHKTEKHKSKRSSKHK